jgi:hypothetical protein
MAPFHRTCEEGRKDWITKHTNKNYADQYEPGRCLWMFFDQEDGEEQQQGNKPQWAQKLFEKADKYS